MSIFALVCVCVRGVKGIVLEHIDIRFILCMTSEQRSTWYDCLRVCVCVLFSHSFTTLYINKYIQSAFCAVELVCRCYRLIFSLWLVFRSLCYCLVRCLWFGFGFIPKGQLCFFFICYWRASVVIYSSNTQFGSIFV